MNKYRRSSVTLVGAPKPRKRTRICTSLSAPTCGELAAKARRAFTLGADLVEFRLDLLRAPSAPEIANELSAFKGQGIFTVRRADEGGGFQGDEPQRRTLIRRISEIRPAYFDVELRTLEAYPELAGAGLGAKTIVSWHGPAGTPSRARLFSLMTGAFSYGGLAKVVPAANSGKDNLAVLSLYGGTGATPIAFCTGSAGLFSRVMAMELGTPLAYASLDGEATAEGQLPLGTMLAIRRRLESA